MLSRRAKLLISTAAAVIVIAAGSWASVELGPFFPKVVSIETPLSCSATPSLQDERPANRGAPASEWKNGTLTIRTSAWFNCADRVGHVTAGAIGNRVFLNIDSVSNPEVRAMCNCAHPVIVTLADMPERAYQIVQPGSGRRESAVESEAARVQASRAAAEAVRKIQQEQERKPAAFHISPNESMALSVSGEGTVSRKDGDLVFRFSSVALRKGRDASPDTPSFVEAISVGLVDSRTKRRVGYGNFPIKAGLPATGHVIREKFEIRIPGVRVDKDLALWVSAEFPDGRYVPALPLQLYKTVCPELEGSQALSC
jgi:hypothetical protein